jgi:hypothetical protein
MPSSLRFWLGVVAGALSLSAAAASLPGSAAAAGASRACGSPAVPVLSVTPAGSPTVTGSVVVAGAGRRMTLTAARHPRSSAAGTTATWLEFCLRPRAVTKAVTLVRIAPAGVSISLTRTGRLTLSAGPRVTLAVAAVTRPELVQVLLDRRQGHVSVFVNGGHGAVIPASIPTLVHVDVGDGGSSAPPTAADTPAVSSASGTPTAFAA